MIMVHDIFVCKPGQASKLAKQLKEGMGWSKEKQVYIMTDLVGQYNRVIMARPYENLAAYEKEMESYKNPSPEMKAAMEKMPNYQDMYLTGTREIYQTW